MNGNDFLDKMEKIKPEYVEEADIKPYKKKTNIIKWGTLAACFVLILFIGTGFLPQDTPIQKKPDSDDTTQNTAAKGSTKQNQSGQSNTSQNTASTKPDLPKLTISDNKSGGMGFEGYMAHNISELVNANPWREDIKLATLPVYKRAVDVDSYFVVTGADWDKMQEFILDVAGRLGLDKNKVSVTDNFAQADEIKDSSSRADGHSASSLLIVNTDGIKIEVDQFMTATVSFEPAKSLPKKYNFTDNAPYDDCLAVADYLKNKYKDFIGSKNPQINISGGSYDIYANQSYSIEFYNGSKDYVENIINYNFNRTAFYGDESGKLWLARIFQPDLSKKLGDYPVIDSMQARELLINDNYITSVPYKMPGEEYIKKVELVYRTGDMEEFYLPYYRFLVELPEEDNSEIESEDGLKSYGAYYVPAAESSYLTNMPVWDGGFN